jgi:hypothetical protein
LDENDLVQNITFTLVNGTVANPGALSGELSEDGKTLTISAQAIFDGEYAFKSTDAIKSSTGVKIPEFTSIVKVDDTVAPKLLSASASAKVSTDKFTLIFDEPVNASGAIVYVNGVAALVSNNATNPNRLDVTASAQVAAGSTATITLTNVKDYNNNFVSPNPLTTSVTVISDTVAPNVTGVKVVGENKVELTYDKNIDLASFTSKARLVHANGTVTPLTASAGKNAKTVILTGALTYTGSYNALLFVDAEVKDSAGNAAAAYSTNVTFNKDVTAPALSTVAFAGGKITATFAEDVVAGTEDEVKVIDQATGVSQTITLDYTAGTGNAVITDNKLTITQALANGTYQLRLAADTVKDTAGVPNSNVITTQTFVASNAASSDTTRPVVASITNVPVVDGSAPGVEQTATYTVSDNAGVNLSTVRDVNNYTWDGKALPAGSYVTTVISGGTASAATAANVTVHVPSAGFSTTKTAAFTVNGIRDNAGNYIVAVGTGSVKFADGVNPTFSSAAVAANGTTLVLGFSEAVTDADKADFVVTLNGTVVPATSVGTLVVSNTEVNKYVTSITASVENDAITNGGTVANPKDVVYFDTDGSAGLTAGDLVIRVLDVATYAADGTEVVNLSAGYVSTLKVKLVDDGVDKVSDLQGNVATFNKEITVK